MAQLQSAVTTYSTDEYGVGYLHVGFGVSAQDKGKKIYDLAQWNEEDSLYDELRHGYGIDMQEAINIIEMVKRGHVVSKRYGNCTAVAFY